MFNDLLPAVGYVERHDDRDEAIEGCQEPVSLTDERRVNRS